jgi:hypothetical protein
MAQIARISRPGGHLAATHIPRHGFYQFGLPSGMQAKYWLRTAWLECCLHVRLAVKGFYRGLVKAEGVLGVCRLHATVIRANGQIEHLGLLSTKLITDAGVAYLVDDWDGGSNVIDLFNFHGCGTGTNAEAAADTTLQTESTTALNPDSTRATGTKSQPAANQARSVGTVTFDASAAITEHGIFTQAATGGGTLWDRSIFSAINVVSADSIQFTHTTTYSAGG